VNFPLLRARETARIIAEGLNTPFGTAYPKLAERDYGELEGTSAAAAIARWPDREYPGAASLDSLAVHGVVALTRIATDFPARRCSWSATAREVVVLEGHDRAAAVARRGHPGQGAPRAH